MIKGKSRGTGVSREGREGGLGNKILLTTSHTFKILTGSNYALMKPGQTIFSKKMSKG